jgi:hypothetical protein
VCGKLRRYGCDILRSCVRLCPIKLNFKVFILDIACILRHYSDSEFEIVLIEVKNKRLVNAVGLNVLSYFSTAVSQHHLQPIQGKGCDCRVDGQ